MATIDASEFDAFVASSYRSLLRTAFLLSGDRGEAEDLVQAALLRTFDAWPRLRDKAAAPGFARTTLVRLAGRWSRRRWRGELPSEMVTFGSAASGADIEAGLDVRRALGLLPWAQRAVLVLRYLDDLSEADTATMLGCSVGTVKSRASRGLAALRTSVELTNEVSVLSLSRGQASQTPTRAETGNGSSHE